jgi:putative membrane protein insertion efficiency factor
MRTALLAVVRFYQRAISPAFPPRCRFYPSCSAYALEAIETHGAGRGSWLALRRLAKCAPWHPGGVDLVPEPRPRRGARTGTPAAGHTSSTAAPLPVPAEAARRPHSITPPARRAPQEESSLA